MHSNTIRYWIKIITTLLLSQWLLISCTSENKDQAESPVEGQDDTTVVLTVMTPIQETAFEAMNGIQIQSENHLYSTFPGIRHDKFAVDSSFMISSAELLDAMEELFERNFPEYRLEQLNRLAADAVLAQDEYLVEHCTIKPRLPVEVGIQSARTVRSGVWILPRVLERRDVIMVW